jgi:hypothetical protein
MSETPEGNTPHPHDSHDSHDSHDEEKQEIAEVQEQLDAESGKEGLAAEEGSIEENGISEG